MTISNWLPDQASLLNKPRMNAECWNRVHCLFLILSAGFLSTECHAFVIRPNLLPHQHHRIHQGGNQRIHIARFSWNPDTDSTSNGEDAEEFEPVVLPDDRETALSVDDVEGLTVSQLKQQLRLRDLKISGKKSDLVTRLLRYSGTYVPNDNDDDERFVDVSEYLDPSEVGAAVKTRAIGEQAPVDDVDEESPEESSPYNEVWGADARIVEDYEGRDLVVDGISRTVIEFTGSNQTAVLAYVAASRDALRPFLQSSNMTERSSAEERLRVIQKQREDAARRPIRFDDEAGLDEGDDAGIYKDILHRDFTDWGKYTPTGAQLSAEEVEGVLLLSDVYGMSNNDTRALAEKIAFECQPVVVMVPDLFHGKPWTGPTDQLNEEGETYEQWRGAHDELRLSVDIRAAAACLRERYAVSSVVVWGTCFGGGRALEAAAGWLPNGSIHDIDGSIGPPLVNPAVAVAWYPTRYNVGDLFGKARQVTVDDTGTSSQKMAVMGVFGGKDTIPGATPDDAANLKALLEQDDRVCDLMVKVFPDQAHGFAHRGLSAPPESNYFERFVDEEFGGAGSISVGSGDAEVACLLSTAFMETYSRVFLPTTGPLISSDESARGEANKVEEINNDSGPRDIRKELEDAVTNFVEDPLDGLMVDPTDESDREELAKILRSMQDPDAAKGALEIDDKDDLNLIYAKLLAGSDKFEIF